MSNNKLSSYGTRINGTHWVVSGHRKVGSQLISAELEDGRKFSTLTQARRACQRGQAIVRDHDRVVVGVKS